MLIPLRPVLFEYLHIQRLPKGFLDFLFTETSSASSRTKFMYSSNPWGTGIRMWMVRLSKPPSEQHF